MKHFTSLLFGMTLGLLGCNSTYKADEEANDNYLRLKSKVSQNVINHFPEYLTSNISSTIANTFPQENNIGLFLYEYEMPASELDSLVSIWNIKKVAKYKSSDTCLLIVNRFDEKYTSVSGVAPDATDSLLINQSCYKGMSPVPNFLDYKGYKLTPCGLDSTFDIFVLEANQGLIFDEYKSLKPFMQMPEKWRNGYSKGMAVSTQNRTIIYWSIVW